MKHFPSLRRASVCMLAAVAAVSQPLAADESKTAAASNAFAFDLYGQLRGQEGNLFLSPSSISTALTMSYGGARGETATQMAKVLHLDKVGKNPHAAIGKFQHSLNALQGKGTLTLATANSLWSQQGYTFLPEYTKLCQSNYGAAPTSVDFVKQPAAACKIINQWVEDQTKDKIKDLLKPSSIDANTRLVLINAIYFKGDWANPFPAKATKSEPFQVATNQKVKVPLMMKSGHFLYGENPDAQIVELPYVGLDLSMVVVLPRRVDGLAALEKKLTAQQFATWTKALQSKEVDLWLPKFRMTTEFSLGDPLEHMGMKDAFSMKTADFSGMTGKRDLFIGAVVHKAFVEVNEKGTEAAAATGVIVEQAAEIPQSVTFRADHPFLFAIRDNKSGGLLFLGRVVNPEAP